MNSDVARRDAPGYEPRDLGERPAWWFAVSFIAVMVLLIAGLTYLGAAIWNLGMEQAIQSAAQPVPAPPPQLQTNPASDLARLRSAAERRLDSYGWIDRKSGIVHIPIAQAMQIEVMRAAQESRR